MRVYVLKDGTVPVAIAKVIARDEGADLEKFNEELAASDAHTYVEGFKVPDEAEYIGVSWDETGGFDVWGFTPLLVSEKSPLDRALDWLNEDASEEAIVESYIGDGHWAVTYNPGDDESYGHVFRVAP